MISRTLGCKKRKLGDPRTQAKEVPYESVDLIWQTKYEDGNLNESRERDFLRLTTLGRAYMSCMILRQYFLFVMVFFALIWPNDKVNEKGEYIDYSLYKQLYFVGDLLLCVPLLIVIFYGMVYEGHFKYGQIPGKFTVILKVVSGAQTIMVNYREFLSVLFINRLRRFYFAVRPNEGLLKNETRVYHYMYCPSDQETITLFKWVYLFFGFFLFCSWVPRLISLVKFIYLSIRESCSGNSDKIKYKHHYHERRKLAKEENILWELL